MNLILLRIFLVSLTLVCLSQTCFTQSAEKSKTDKKIVAPTVSVRKCDKTTKNTKAEKWCNDGLDLAVQQKFDEAIAAFTRAIELDPKYVAAYVARGVTYNWKKDNGLAIADFTSAIELAPKRVDLYLNRGSIYFVELKKYEFAIADFTKAIELDPTNGFFYRTRARIYDITGRKDLADADWQKAQDLRSAPKQ